VRGDPQELGAAVGRVVVIGGQAIADEQVGQALHALAGQVQGAGHLRHRRRLILHRFENQPARQRLAGRLGQRLPGGGEAAGEPDDLAEDRGEGIPSGGA
jgi:hypothetical protein